MCRLGYELYSTILLLNKIEVVSVSLWEIEATQAGVNKWGFMVPFFIGFGLFTKEEDITNIFVKYGSIVETKFIKDTYTGQNKGIPSIVINIFI